MRQVTSLVGPILLSNSSFFNLSDSRQLEHKVTVKFIGLILEFGYCSLDIQSVRDQKEYMYCSSSLNEHFLMECVLPYQRFV